MKIKAFTLLELIIGMVVSGIVIGTCYSAYNLIYKQFLDYKKVRTILIDFATLNTELGNNFYHSKNVFKKDNGLDFKYDNKTIFFEFENQFILRGDLKSIDTFNIKVDSFAVVENSNGIVTNVLIKSNLFNENVELYFNKTYSAEELMNSVDNKD